MNNTNITIIIKIIFKNASNPSGYALGSELDFRGYYAISKYFRSYWQNADGEIKSHWRRITVRNGR